MHINNNAIEYDAINDIWRVNLQGNIIKCNSEYHAIFFYENILWLHEQTRTYETFKDDSNKRKSFLHILERAVGIIKYYPQNPGFRALRDFYERIPESERF